MRDQQQQQDQQRQQRQRQVTATATAAASGHQRPQQQINQQRQQQSSQHANITVSQSGTTGLLALPQQPQPLRRSPRRHPSSYLNQGQQQETQQLQASNQPETKTTTTTTRNAKRPRKSSGGSTHQKESELMQQQQTQQMPLRKQQQQQKQQQKQQQQQQQQGRSSSVDAADDGNISSSGNEPKRRRSDSSTCLFASSLISVTEGTRLVNLDASQFLLSQSSTTFPLISTQSMIGRGMTYESVCMIWSPSTPKSRKVPKELIKTVHDLFSDISNMGSSFIHRNRYWRTQCPVDVHQAQAAFQYINDHFPAELQRAVLTGMASAARKFVKANGMLMEYHLGLLMWLLINPLVATYCNEKMPDYNQQQQQHSSQSNKDEVRGGIVGYEMVTLSLEFLCSLSIPLKQRIVTLLIAPQPEPPSDPNAPNAFMYESCEQVNDAKSKARSLRVFVKAIQAVITARVEHIANNERAGSVTAEASNSAATTATATAASNTTAATTETQSTDSEPMDIEETTTTPETVTAASTDQAPIQTASPQQAPSQPLPPRDPFAIINSNAIIAGLRPPAAFAALSLRNQQLRNLALPGSAPNPALANGNSNASMKGLVYHKDVLIARSLKYLTFLQRLNLTHGELWFTSNYSSTGTLYNALGMNSNQHPSQSQSGSDKAGSSTNTSTSTSTSTESKVTAYIHNGINDICLLFSGTPPDSMTLRAIDNREDGLLLPNEFYNESLSRTICIATEVTINRDQGITDAFSSTNDTCFHHYPFVLTPLAKAELMRHENLSEQRQELHDAFFRAMFVGMTCPYLIIEVRREHVVRDALVQLWGKSTNDLKKALKVRFVGEEGVDEGGVTREFLSLVVREIFNSEYGMFRYYEDSHLYWFRLAPQCDVLVNPSKYLTEPWSSSPSGKSIEEYALRVRQQYLSDSTTGTTFEMPSNLDKNMINEYRLIGQLIGLAAYNSAMVGINFPRALYRKLCGRRVRLCDLAEFEPELARGLQMMLDYETDDPDEFELLFGRNFVMEYDHFGEMVTQPLVHGGESIPLTLANRQEYVNLYVEMVLSILVYRQYEAFREGFHSIMGSPHQLLAQNLNPSPSRSYLIESLEPHELELIICGHNYDNLDLHELESVCQYDGGYNRESSVICNFWDVVHNDFTVEQRRLLLKFVTGTDRVPVGGFSKLTFVISKNGVGESDRLPTAHTCFNVMLLCEYETRETLKDRLLTAINNAEGFGMH